MKTHNDVIDRARKAHHLALESLRGPDCQLSGMQIWRRLCALEQLAHSGATAYCNGETVLIAWPLFGPEKYDFRNDENAWERLCSRATDCVRNILGTVPAGFFVNGDARGYALKIDPDTAPIPEGMHTDWGRNGILAAQINN